MKFMVLRKKGLPEQMGNEILVHELLANAVIKEQGQGIGNRSGNFA